MADRSALDEFLTPEAMLTPGVAGALTMMITNALGTNFQTPRAWTALLLSFGFGLLVLVSDKRLLMKALFYVLNSLVIFCVANGANGVGVAQRASATIFNSAFAQPANITTSPNETATSEQLLATYRNLTTDYNGLTQKIEAAKNNSTSKDEVIGLIDQRDKINEQRQSIFALLLKRADLSPQQLNELGGPNSVINNPGQVLRGENEVNKIIRKPFFSPWKF
jgi:hypothetical protein